MCIECACPLRPSAEAWLGDVFFARDELGQDGNDSSMDKEPRGDEDFP
jgi:hypothetical protein